MQDLDNQMDSLMGQLGSWIAANEVPLAGGILGAGLLAAGALRTQTGKRISRRIHRRIRKKFRKHARFFRHARTFKGRVREHRRGHFGTAKQFERKGGAKVRFTKRGQPFVILKSGRARFLKRRGR